MANALARRQRPRLEPLVFADGHAGGTVHHCLHVDRVVLGAGQRQLFLIKIRLDRQHRHIIILVGALGPVLLWVLGQGRLCSDCGLAQLFFFDS